MFCCTKCEIGYLFERLKYSFIIRKIYFQRNCLLIISWAFCLYLFGFIFISESDPRVLPRTWSQPKCIQQLSQQWNRGIAWLCSFLMSLPLHHVISSACFLYFLQVLLTIVTMSCVLALCTVYMFAVLLLWEIS